MSENALSTKKEHRLRGRSVRLSAIRKGIIDLLRFSKEIPSVPVQRRMNIAAVVAARQQLENRPSWVVLFTKAYAKVCSQFAELRRAYLSFPFPRLFEASESVASVAIEREHEGEKVLIFFQMRGVEHQSLPQLHDHLAFARTMPLNIFHSFRTFRKLSWLPGPLRRFGWWLTLYTSGRWKMREFGTFGVSVYSNLGAESLHPLSPLTTLLNFGPVSADGAVDVRLVYDHRVTDGATIARALASLEEILNQDIAVELQALAAEQRANKLRSAA